MDHKNRDGQFHKSGIGEWLTCALDGADALPLSWAVLPLSLLFFSYFLLLGKNCVFSINDQLDETLFTYVLNARYLFSGVKEYPELLCGVPAGGMTVSAWLFVPLYRMLPYFGAFMVQAAVVTATAYLGMYLCVKELTGSSLIGVLCGTMFMFLPYQPVYGLSVIGGPLVFYAFLCLLKRKHVILSQILILYFALGANLVLLGYVVLGLVFLADLVLLWMDLRGSGREEGVRYRILKGHLPFYIGSFELLLFYILINRSLFAELILGGGGYVSHREEMVIEGMDAGAAMLDVFLHSAQHAPTHHEKLLLPLLLITVFFGLGFKRLGKENRSCWLLLVTIWIVNLLIALFYGFCQSSLVVDFRNGVSGFLHYFSAYRVYWLYPTSWYVGWGLAMALLWRGLPEAVFSCRIPAKPEATGENLREGNVPGGEPAAETENCSKRALLRLAAGFLICVLSLPTAWEIRQNSIWILNKSQYKNNCSVGLMSWKDYFAEELMADIAESIRNCDGLNQQEYRIASLGISPAVPLEAGFYCIDGYSNNYSLDYKHRFRKIIEKELDKCPAMKTYFDDWGSRCYLFTKETQNYYYLAKDADFRYEDLELDTDAMKELGCRYIFSGAEIEKQNAENMHLELMDSFDTPDSYYRIWVYRIRG